ncbi:LPXTG-motif cell wall-anchored protein [Planomicrobium stackebrandtii]|uniref:LPXTG-motif cell wall-anchored protein n=1 Tax=Planomicrobium stackebrandtii TaxID=253160 RepID=A0ABU0GUL0_9BACL|nr:excalibur calcium-binding domain-containing protein [Planomicrobium stackebrandtii]MDQ0428768.1 LPXTG-motif cell wall-anchored protein [Planomicrobium stackebrandtii]
MKKKLVGVVFGSFLVLGSALNVGAVENDRDCGDFADGEAQVFWDENGYSAENDPHRLDADSDGVPCEGDSETTESGVVEENISDDSSDETVAEEEAATEEDETEEGAALPNTASNGPLMMLFGAGLAGVGSLLLFRRKNQNA